MIRVQRSDMEKLADALSAALKVEKARDEMNAYIHLAGNVRYSPVTSEIEAGLERAVSLLNDDDGAAG